MASFDKLVHERARLLILTFLASSDKREVSFGQLQKELDFTPGNLSVQLKKLNEADYIKIRKTFKDNKPYTTAEITPAGKKALNAYLDEMEAIIKSIRL